MKTSTAAPEPRVSNRPAPAAHGAKPAPRAVSPKPVSSKAVSSKAGASKARTAAPKSAVSKATAPKSAAPKSAAPKSAAKPAVPKTPAAKPAAPKAGVKAAARPQAAKPAPSPAKEAAKKPAAASPSPAKSAPAASPTPAKPLPAKPPAAPLQARQAAPKAPVASPPRPIATTDKGHAVTASTPTAAAVPAAPAPVAAVPAAAPAPVAAAPKPAAPDLRPVLTQRPMGKDEHYVEGDYVVYPTHGVGKVERIAVEEIAGHKLELIHITFEENRMTLRVPVAKARTAGLRKLATRKMFDEALAILKGRARIKRTMWSRRAQEYEAKINSGDPLSIAEVVRDLHRNAGQPDQSFSERQIYEAAMERLAAELAALDKTDRFTAAAKLEAFLKSL